MTFPLEVVATNNYPLFDHFNEIIFPIYLDKTIFSFLISFQFDKL